MKKTKNKNKIIEVEMRANISLTSRGTDENSSTELGSASIIVWIL